MGAGAFLIEQFDDNNGDPLASGKVFTYDPGTTTPRTSYQDQALTSAHANPIILDANGRPPAPIWLNGETKVVVKTSADVVVGPTYDNMNADATGLGDWSTKNAGVLTKTATYAVLTADDGKLIVATSGTWALTTDAAAATMGDGFAFQIYNSGTGVITFNPTGAETVNGSLTALIQPGHYADIRCDGSNWHMMLTQRPIVASAQATTSGRSVTFSSIPSWVTKIDVLVSGVSSNGTTDALYVRIGDSGGVEITGYLCTIATHSGTDAQANSTTSFQVSTAGSAAAVFHGVLSLVLLDSTTNTWVINGGLGRSDFAAQHTVSGSKALSGTLTQLTFGLLGSTDNFDAGKVSIRYS